MSAQLATIEDRQTAPAAPPSKSDAIVKMIERAVTNAAIDIEKLKQLIEMRQQIEAQEAERIFNSAMRSAQAEMRPVGADAANTQTRSRYATFAALDRVLRPIYTKFGFSLSFDEGDTPKPDHIRILCYVAHEDGHTRVYRKDMPADGKGAKGGDVMTKTHAAGAAASYGARYLLKGIFNVAVGEDDRDGNELTESGGLISEEQADEVMGLIATTGSDIARFCRYMKIDGVAAMPASKYAAAIAALKAKGGRQ